MKIDKEKLEKLLEKDDAELWREVITIARGKGLNLPDTPPPKEITWGWKMLIMLVSPHAKYFTYLS